MSGAPDWYVEKRREVRARFSESTPGEAEIHRSPSGRYRLEITRWSTGPSTWAYSRGRVFDGERHLTDVERNYGAFPFSWSEAHPSGHDYLVCGEDYQGQTVVELDTGERVDHIEAAAREGFGFCWAAHYPSPRGEVIAVDGCIWAGPYEIVLLDFGAPMRLPYREIARAPVTRVIGWQADGSFSFENDAEVRVSDGRRLDDLPEDECDAIYTATNYRELVRERRERAFWHPDAPSEITVLDDE